MRTHRAQPRHQVLKGGQDLAEAPSQRAIVGKEGEFHIDVAGCHLFQVEHGLEANTEEEHGEGITLLYAFEALEARDGAIRSGVPEPVRAIGTVVGLEVAVAAMEGGAFESRLTDQRERGIENGLSSKGV